MLCGGSTGGTVSRNKIYDIRYAGIGSSSPYPLILGINVQSTAVVNAPPVYTFTNNMVSLTNGDPSDKMFFREPESNLFHQDIPPVTVQNSPLVSTLQKSLKEKADEQKVQNSVIDPVASVYDKNSEEYRKSINGNGNGNLMNSKGNNNGNLNSKGNGNQHDNATINCSIAGVYQTTTSLNAYYYYYYNSIYVGGSQPGGSFSSWAFLRANSSATANTSNANTFLRNNLLIDARTGGGNNYVIGNEGLPSTTGWSSTASNYNVFLGSNANTIGEWTLNNPQTIQQWRTSSSGENQTWSTTTAAVNPVNLLTNIPGGNLTIQTGNTEAWLVKGKGIAVSGQNIDYLGNPRSTTISGGVTCIGANEFAAVPPNSPAATETGTPGSGATTVYTLWGRTMAQIDWGTGGTSYPSSISAQYFSGVNPPNTVGGNYSNSYSTIAPVSGTLTNATYNLTYYFGDNETYTIATPASNTVLAKYNTSWEVFPPGGGTYQTQLTYNLAGQLFTAKVNGLWNFSNFALTDNNSPLPIVLSSFTISPAGRDANITWVTQTEMNNHGFYLERRTKVNANTYSTWQSLGFTQGKGNSNIPTTYKYTDKKLDVGDYQYRLKQVDNNGNFEYHNPSNNTDVIIGKPISSEMSQNYPNPSNPKSKIDYQIPFDGKVSIKVYDITGREVVTLINTDQQAGYYTTEFDGTNLASGIYFYRIIAEGGGQKFIKTLKMVIVK
jgi:hypothetical protein